jgi:hypothetical protein
MKKLFFLGACALLLASCEKEEGPRKVNIQVVSKNAKGKITGGLFAENQGFLAWGLPYDKDYRLIDVAEVPYTKSFHLYSECIGCQDFKEFKIDTWTDAGNGNLKHSIFYFTRKEGNRLILDEEVYF